MVNELIAAAQNEAARQNAQGEAKDEQAAADAPSPEDGEDNQRICEKCPRWRYETGANHISLGAYHTFLRITELQSRTSSAHRAGPSNDDGGSNNPFGLLWGRSSQTDGNVKPEEGHQDPTDGYGYINPSFFPSYEGSMEDDRVHRRGQNKYVTIEEHSDSSRCLEIDGDIADANQLVDQKRIAYHPTGPNSNSYTMTVEKYSGLDPRKPSVSAPGWGIDLLKGESKKT